MQKEENPRRPSFELLLGGRYTCLFSSPPCCWYRYTLASFLGYCESFTRKALVRSNRLTVIDPKISLLRSISSDLSRPLSLECCLFRPRFHRHRHWCGLILSHRGLFQQTIYRTQRKTKQGRYISRRAVATGDCRGAVGPGKYFLVRLEWIC